MPFTLHDDCQEDEELAQLAIEALRWRLGASAHPALLRGLGAAFES